MSFRIRAKPSVPSFEEDPQWWVEPETARPIDAGYLVEGFEFYAQWDDKNRRSIGWVVKEGAEKYIRENLDFLAEQGWTLTVEEYDE